MGGAKDAEKEKATKEKDSKDKEKEKPSPSKSCHKQAPKADECCDRTTNLIRKGPRKSKSGSKYCGEPGAKEEKKEEKKKECKDIKCPEHQTAKEGAKFGDSTKDCCRDKLKCADLNC